MFLRAVPLLDDKGEIIEWFGTASDITDRKPAEEALREAREQAGQQKGYTKPLPGAHPT